LEYRLEIVKNITREAAAEGAAITHVISFFL
jgi:hypothetical protein